MPIAPGGGNGLFGNIAWKIWCFVLSIWKVRFLVIGLSEVPPPEESGVFDRLVSYQTLKVGGLK